MSEKRARVVFLLVVFCVFLRGEYGQASARIPKSDPAPRTVFVQLFEWPWQDVARECETVLGPAGIAAVQVSPPQEHLDWPGSPWWERYQPVSYEINSRAGDARQFQDMIKRCKRVNVDVYADAVINHMAGMASGFGFGGTPFEHHRYPGLYEAQDFHKCGRNGNDDILNFLDPWEVQNCELLNLADLKTESASVRQKITDYLNELLKMGVAGLRIDAAKHIPWTDLRAIFSGLKSPVFLFQELILGYQEPISYADYLQLGDVSDYPYPFIVSEAFFKSDIGRLLALGHGVIPTTEAIVFLTNHDIEREKRPYLLSVHQNLELYRLAQVFMLAWPYGYPQLYSGYRFQNFDEGPPLNAQKQTKRVLDQAGKCVQPWTCEHRWPEVLQMVKFRNLTNHKFFASHLWTNSRNQISFGRGDAGFVAINASATEPLKMRLAHGMKAGLYCNLLASDYDPITQKCQTAIRFDAGHVDLNLPPRTALAVLSEDAKSRR